MMSAFFHFQYTLNRSFNNYIKLHWNEISSSGNMKGASNWLEKSVKICGGVLFLILANKALHDG